MTPSSAEEELVEKTNTRPPRNSIGDARRMSYGTIWRRMLEVYAVVPEHELRVIHLRWKKLAATT